MTALPELTTERLVVRPFRAADLADCAAVFGDDADDAPAVARRRRFLAWAELNHGVLADLRQPPYGDRAVVLRDTGALVGSVGLVPLLAPFGQIPSARAGDGCDASLLTPELGLYWAVASAHRRRGIATEAARSLVDHLFGAMRVRRVVATTEHDNAESIGVMRRLGMRIERNPLTEPAWLQTVGVLENTAALPR